MSIINCIDRGETVRKAPHPTKVSQCVAYIVEGEDGRRYVEVDTFGSADRVTPGQASQMMQFTEESARALRALIDSAFPVSTETIREALEDQREQEAVVRYSMKQAAKVAKENPY